MIAQKFLKVFPTPRFLKFSYVGFEISQNRIRYAEVLNKDGKGIGLGRFGECSYTPTEDMFSNEDLKRVLRDIAQKEKITHIKATLPEESTYLFTIEVDGSNNEEIRNSIEFHLEENVPVAGSDALFDFYLLPTAVNEPKKAVVSVVSSEIVEKYIGLFEECGLTPVAFMAESSSFSRAIIKKGDMETNVLVYVSQNKTVFSVASRGYVQFSSTLSVGGSVMTDALKKYFAVSQEDAEKMKKENGFEKRENSEVMSALINAIAVLRDEIERIEIYWRTHHDKENQSPIKKVLLIGSDAIIPGFSEYLSLSLRTPVRVGNVWENFPRYNTEVPPLHFNEAVSFGACIGLSLTSL